MNVPASLPDILSLLRESFSFVADFAITPLVGIHFGPAPGSIHRMANSTQQPSTDDGYFVQPKIIVNAQIN